MNAPGRFAPRRWKIVQTVGRLGRPDKYRDCTTIGGRLLTFDNARQAEAAAARFRRDAEPLDTYEAVHA